MFVPPSRTRLFVEHQLQALHAAPRLAELRGVDPDHLEACFPHPGHRALGGAVDDKVPTIRAVSVAGQGVDGLSRGTSISRGKQSRSRSRDGGVRASGTQQAVVSSSGARQVSRW